MSIRITHFSDVLCIWAYISQVRIAELRANFAAEVAFDYRYFSVFGDVPTKMATQWREKGGLAGYAKHVEETVAQFEHVNIHRDTWTACAPTSSLPAHLVLSAARLTAQDVGADGESVLALDHEIRRSFFEDAVNVSRTDALLEICAGQPVDTDAIEAALRDGSAHAALSGDIKQAQELPVRASPTLTFNEGRQILTGNVGYRVIEANIRELLRQPADQLSWC